METPFNTPIWLSDWSFEDGRGKSYVVRDVVVKGKTKGDIFLNKKINFFLYSCLLDNNDPFLFEDLQISLNIEMDYSILNY